MKKPVAMIAFLIFCATQETYSKAGPSIPLPAVSIEEAIALSRKAFSENTINLKNAGYFSKFILSSVNYVQDNKSKNMYWVWQTIFVHPVDNDCKWCYEINQNKEIKLLWTSK